MGSIKWRLFSITVSVVVLLDQATKLAISRKMMLHESIPVINGFFSLTYIRNPGAAFGLLADHGSDFRLAFFLISSSLAIVLLGFFFFRTAQNDYFLQFCFSLIFGGAIGNLIDRVRFGEVVDFLDFYINGYHWPAFNVADSSITVGISLLMMILIIRKDTRGHTH